jgi:hypothetical protein
MGGYDGVCGISQSPGILEKQKDKRGRERTGTTALEVLGLEFLTFSPSSFEWSSEILNCVRKHLHVWGANGGVPPGL